MTSLHLHRSSGFLARSALLTLALAGCATAGAAQQGDDAEGSAGAPRIAVLAGSDASSADIAAATHGRAVVVRRASGTFEAQAQATRLAAEGYDTVIGVGAQARAAVSQADAGEVGAGTRWQSASR
ncbi:hypothetical protein DSM104299_05206 [Baekduia alba]|uniref:hypothetical protein n=1 Tax=Baekduia alba TaxID=2997333 RepID=UPI0023417299|nr:hypothetical protein [Baekduia alba]WCB96447.1 hypothetical protein DSM104299_05206 [Baekduia alba]